jgi:hypothetical protein
MGGGVGDQPAADQPVAAIGADVVLVAELGDRQVDHRRLALARLRFGRLDGPARIAILLAELRRLVLPILRHPAFPDRLLLGLGVALLGGGDDARVDQLPGHGEVTSCPELPVVQGEQAFDRAGLGASPVLTPSDVVRPAASRDAILSERGPVDGTCLRSVQSILYIS